MGRTMIIALFILAIVLLSIGIFVAKKALKMKAQGKENFKLYAVGCTVTMPGIILLVYCCLEFIFNILV